LSDFKWKNRVLVVVTEKKDDIQDLIKNYNIELDEREFLVIHFDGKRAFIDDKKMSKRFSNSIQKKIRNISQEIHFVLIGKDGRVKNLYSRNANVNEIFLEVDKMPMRINEMKRNLEND
tara:strand:+ start:113 stop:469 length:357 start_codon:yes stop_codon:yes gene_type:complete